MRNYGVRLATLLMAAVLPVVVIASVLVVYVARQERGAAEAEARARVARVADLVDREIGAHLRVLQALATSANLDRPDLGAFHGEARRVLASEPGWLTVVLNDLDGRQILSARQPLDRPPVSVIEPRSYEEVLRTGRPTAGGISEPSPSTGVRAVPLRVPVVRDGRVRYVLTAPVTPDSLGLLLRDSGIPADWIGAVVDREGRIVARSRDAETHIGRSANERTLVALRSGAAGGFYEGRTLDGVAVVVAFRRSALTGWSVHFGVPRVAFDVAHSRTVLAALVGALGSVCLGAALAWLIHRDLTAQRRQEAMLRQAQKMEAIGRMTGGVAHDFNNLLAVVRSAAELLRHRPDDTRRDLFLDGIVEATERGARLTGQLLSFAGRREWRPEAVDLAERVPAIAELLRPSLRGGIELRPELPKDLWPVEVDPGELELALLNLATNARDAMPDGGVVRLAAGNLSLPRSGEDVPGLKGDYVRLAVTDTGAGMAPEVAERAFEPFFTTKERGKGTGLGLSQVYGFAHQAGGTAAIRSRPKAGTTVALYLPRTRKAPAATGLVAGAKLAPVRRLSVLVVEDDPAVSSTAAALLEQLGHAAVAVDRAGKALAMLANGQRFDLVFSDVVMPGDMDGIRLAHEVRRRHPGLSVLLATGYPVDVERGPGGLNGIRVLRKPYGVDALREAIDESVGGGTRRPAASPPGPSAAHPAAEKR